jgi:flagellar basal body-associated protein FliL
MKKDEKLAILCIVLILIAATFCGCARTFGAVDAKPDEGGVIGYAIIHHADGDEHAPIVDYYYSYGTITAYCADGRTVISNNITLMIE